VTTSPSITQQHESCRTWASFFWCNFLPWSENSRFTVWVRPKRFGSSTLPRSVTVQVHFFCCHVGLSIIEGRKDGQPLARFQISKPKNTKFVLLKDSLPCSCATFINFIITAIFNGQDALKPKRVVVELMNFSEAIRSSSTALKKVRFNVIGKTWDEARFCCWLWVTVLQRWNKCYQAETNRWLEPQRRRWLTLRAPGEGDRGPVNQVKAALELSWALAFCSSRGGRTIELSRWWNKAAWTPGPAWSGTAEGTSAWMTGWITSPGWGVGFKPTE